MKLQHVGVIVHPIGGIESALKTYGALGYQEVFRIRRNEPWIGEIVGYVGADIEIVHLKRANDPVGIELLAYHSKPRPHLGIQHLAFEVEDLDAARMAIAPGGAHGHDDEWIGEAVIPDGPNEGTRCAYIQGSGLEVIELIQKPPKPEPERTIDAIQEIRSKNNSRWMDVVRLAMRVAPEEARKIFDQIEANDAEILALSAHMRKK